jgi:O-antigen/teichoic acid export membrane protein
VSEDNSYRQILRSSSIIGGAAVIQILLGLFRTKVAAVLLGPAGIGLISLLQSLMATAATIAALGFSTVGSRQIAEAAGRGDEAAIAAARRALLWGTLVLAIVGAAIVWCLRGILAAHVLDDPGRENEIGWLAVGVALTVASGSQGALLNGLRRIGDLARVSVASAAVSSAIGIAALLTWHERGVLIFVLAAPIASFVLGHWRVGKLRQVQVAGTPLSQLTDQWRTLARLGAAFMVSGLMVAVGQLLVRAMVQRKLGAEALGHFQAAWAISMTYIGFVLTAMGTDYYPRLTAHIGDHAKANRLVNEQTEVALLLSGPMFLALLALAPWVIKLLYSDSFGDAAIVLRWQVLGDILKVGSWPLGFVILASGDGRTFMWSESLAIAVFACLTWIGLPILGLVATGGAFLGMYVVYLPVAYWLARRRTAFRWHARVFSQFIALALAAVIVDTLAAFSAVGGAALGIAAAVGFALYGLARLAIMTELTGPAGKVAHLGRQLMLKMGARRE